MLIAKVTTVKEKWRKLHRIEIEGEPISANWRKTLAGKTIYVVGDMEAITELMDTTDYATGNPSKGITSINCHGKRKIRFVSIQSWGLETEDEFDARNSLETIEDTLTQFGIENKGTAAQTVAAEMRKLVGKNFVRESPIPYRTIHCGPIVHVRGGSMKAKHYDRKAAFLDALAQDLPFPGSGWSPTRNIERADFFSGVFYVPPNSRRLGALNIVASNGSIEYPTGYVKGNWIRPTIEMALELGAYPVEYTAMYRATRVGDWTAPIVEKIKAILPISKTTAKALYTRAWGVTVPSVPFRGTKVPARIGELAIPRFGVWWRKVNPPKVGLTDTPVAAWIASHNYARTMLAAQKSEENVIAAHVDAVWIEDRLQTGDNVGDWKEVGNGPVRFLRPGTYISRWKTGAMAGDPFKILTGEIKPAAIPEAKANPTDMLPTDREVAMFSIRTWDSKPEENSKADSIVYNFWKGEHK